MKTESQLDQRATTNETIETVVEVSEIETVTEWGNIVGTITTISVINEEDMALMTEIVAALATTGLNVVVTLGNSKINQTIGTNVAVVAVPRIVRTSTTGTATAEVTETVLCRIVSRSWHIVVQEVETLKTTLVETLDVVPITEVSLL